MRRIISLRKYYNSRTVAGDGYKVADLRERVGFVEGGLLIL
jgi:hypothetical protein